MPQAQRIKTARCFDMPFESAKQKRYLYASEPAVARKFQQKEEKSKVKRKPKKKDK